MRRKDRQITDQAALENIIRSAQVCRIAMIDNGSPYIVPLNFGYCDNTFYFHSAGEGRKIDILTRGDQVCLELDCGHELVTADSPCNWGMRYTSVIAMGVPRFIEEPAAKRKALDLIMGQYAIDRTFVYPDEALAATTVFAVDVKSMTGKQKC